jgi:hypothetical protein
MICLRINIEKPYLMENAEEVNRAGTIRPAPIQNDTSFCYDRGLSKSVS